MQQPDFSLTQDLQTVEEVKAEFSLCDSYYIGLRLSPTHETSGDVVDLHSIVANFCALIDVHRTNKQIHDMRIVHMRQNQLDKRLL